MRAYRALRRQGGAVIWVLSAIVLIGVVVLVWQRSKPKPKPKPVIAVATPLPATPVPATPTPTPTPVPATPTPPPPPVVVATPTPPPTLDLATIARTPALWPAQVLLVQPTAFPVSLNGRVVGEAKAPAGTALRVSRVQNQHVEVEYQAARHFIPVASTDLMQRAQATFRNNGYGLPQGPVATPPPTTAAATPPPSTAAIRVEVDADRKRIDLVRDTKARAGQVRDSVEKCNYTVKVQSRSFVDVPELEMQYVIFIERQKLGERKDKDTIERVAGAGKVPPLTRKAAVQTVSTSEFELHERELAGGFYYPGGGREKVADGVVGVWVKVSHEGKVIAEYTNPSTVTKRGWEAAPAQ